MKHPESPTSTAYLFDLDKTALNIKQLVELVIAALAPKLGRSVDQLKDSYEKFRIAEKASNLQNGKVDTTFMLVNLCQYWRSELNIADSIDLYQLFLTEVEAMAESCLYPDFLVAVGQLRRFGRIGIYSQGENEWQNFKIVAINPGKNGIDEQLIFVDLDKSSPEFLANLVQNLTEQNISEVVIIDDSLTILQHVLTNWPTSLQIRLVLYLIDRSGSSTTQSGALASQKAADGMASQIIRISSLTELPQLEENRLAQPIINQ